MAFNINEIRANLRSGGARPTLFQVTLDSPFSAELASVAPFMVQAATLPSSSISAIQVPYWGRKIKVAGDREFDDWQVSVMNDEDFKVRHALETWHNRINSMSGNLNTTASSAPSNYKTQAEVKQYSKIGGPPVRIYKFYGIFPTAIGSIDVNWDATNQIETFAVTFSYDWFEVVGGTTGTVI